MRQGTWRLLVLLGALATLLAACGGQAATTEATGADQAEEAAGELTPVRLQLQWVTQSQFAGYFAARDQGFYEEEGLQVEILEGAVDIVPQQVVAAGEAEFGLAWVPKALVSNEEGANLVNVAQVFQRSGTLEVSWAESGITEPADWAGKQVGTWGFGNEFELTAAIEKFDVPNVEIVQQPFDMSLLLNREVDAAQAMTYNEYAQVLEAVNPETGELYQPQDLSVIDFNEVGTAMLQDAVWVRQDWLAEEGNEDLTERFLRASFRGWVFCRENFEECVDIVLANGPTLGESHQTWMLNEINKLIWPSPNGIGVMDEEQWSQTVEVATSQEVITEEPPEDTFRTDLAEQAVADLEAEDLDVRGEAFEPVEVELREGGE
ncbi:MAG: ABC transporter substrate-binding protein [Actinomycetota bacterium]|nr:ABC transporter substrate-binding protein [Actinomycetota bacterium]